MGELLAEQAPAEADLVMGVPESGVPAAEGFARASGIPYGQGLVKNRYIGRSFIAPDQQARGDAVRRASSTRSTETIAGKRFRGGGRLHSARGTTQRSVVRMLREAGAAGGPFADLGPAVALALLLRHRTPPRTRSCWRPITASRRWPQIFGADSLAYISVENLKEAIGARTAGSAMRASPATIPTPCPTTAPRR